VVADSAASGTSVNAPKPDVADPNVPVFDYTHLGPKGSAFFARMVADELSAAVPALRGCLISDRYFARLRRAAALLACFEIARCDAADRPSCLSAVIAARERRGLASTRCRFGPSSVSRAACLRVSSLA